MRLRLRTSLNLGASALGHVVSAAVGLATIPYLIAQYGLEVYGVWALVVVISTYFTLIDLGVTTAAGRLIAAERVTGDADRVAAIVTAAFVFYCVIAVTCVVLGAVLAWFLIAIFNIPPEHVREAMISVFVSGVGVAVYFLYSVFTSTLWAHERFDYINGIEIVSQLARAAAIFTLIGPSSSLVDLAAIMLCGHLLSGALSVLACWRRVPDFRIRFNMFSLTLVRRLIGLGSSFFLVNAGLRLNTLVGTTVVGARMGPSDVASFSVARQLITYSNAFLSAVTQVAAARSVVLHASSQFERQRQLFWYGAVFSSAFAFYIVGGFIVLGEAFMQLWQGGRMNHVYLLLIILAIGEALPMSQWVTNGVIMGMGRQRTLVILHFSEAVCALVSAVIAGRYFDLIGVCVAIAANATIFRGVLQWHFGLRLLGVSSIRYIGRALAPAAAICIALVVASWLSDDADDVSSWVGFALALGVYSLLYWSIFWILYRVGVIRLQV